ncbi:MAG: MFS transporter [Gammaproteobacteria bacterium]|nr:MFS transporter [Gammaproteobacteria bacterium]MDH3468254.1 MFS transporter [Gammaproteobacteria bacterium]
MGKLITPIAALLVSVALLQTGNGLQGTLLPIRAEIEAFSTFSIGFLGSTYYVGFAMGCLLGPYFIRQVGHIRVFTAMTALCSAVPLAHGLLLLPAPWWLLRVLTGFCFAVLFIVIESWLNERATKQTRGTILAIYLVINLTVMTLGQMMLTLFEASGFVLFAIVSILVSVAAVPVALSVAQAPAPIQRIKISLPRVFRASPVGFVGCFAIGAANGAFWALGPIFAGATGLPVSGIAIFMSITVIAGAAGQLPIGKLSDHIDRRKVLLTVSLLAAGAGSALWWHGETTGNGLFILAVFWGFVAFPMYGLAVAHANDYAAADQFVEVTGGLLLVFAAGAVIGPMIAASLITYFHAASLYAYTAAVHLILASFVFWQMRQRAPAHAEEQVRFIDALEASQTVSTSFDSERQEDLVRLSEAKTKESTVE